MKSSIIYTSTLSLKLMSWLEGYAKREKVTKKAIIELALSKYMNESKKNDLIGSFKRASLDMDIIKMSEEGIDDFNEQLNKIDL